MKRMTILAVVSLSLFNPAIQSFAEPFSVSYDFTDVTTSSGTTDPTSPPITGGLSFGSFTAVGYAGNPNATGRFSWTGNPLGGVNGGNDFSAFTGSLDPEKYFEVTLTPSPGASVELDSISFTVQRSSTGIRSYAVRSSADNFGANLSGSISPENENLAVDGANTFQWLLDSVSTAQNGTAISLGAGFEDLSEPVSFRIYGWNAEGASGSFSIDNVGFSGVAAVPEPKSMLLLGIGAGVWVLSRLNKRHRL